LIGDDQVGLVILAVRVVADENLNVHSVKMVTFDGTIKLVVIFEVRL